MSTPQCHEINVMTFDAECHEICFGGRKTNVMTLLSWNLENVMRFIFSGTGSRYDDTNTHSIKILSGGLVHGEVLPRDEANVSGDFRVPFRYFTQSCWTQWQSYETLKCRSLLNLCMMHPITITMIFISGQQASIPIGNSSYQAGKPVALSVRVIVQLENEIRFLITKNVNSWC